MTEKTITREDLKSVLPDLSRTFRLKGTEAPIKSSGTASAFPTCWPERSGMPFLDRDGLPPRIASGIWITTGETLTAVWRSGWVQRRSKAIG